MTVDSFLDNAMGSLVMVVLLLVVGAATWIVVASRRRRRALALALDDVSCVVCESRDVERLDEDGHYHCRECLFRDEAVRSPELERVLTEVRDLREGLGLLEQARRKLHGSLGGDATAEEANALVSRGLNAIGWLVRKQPELLDGTAVGTATVGREIGLRDIARLDRKAGAEGAAAGLVAMQVQHMVEVKQELRGTERYVEALMGRLTAVADEKRRAAIRLSYPVDP